MDNPAASYFKVLRDPSSVMENTTQLFLGVRFNCNKCHDHPFERWTQDQYYQLSSYFAQVGRKPDDRDHHEPDRDDDPQGANEAGAQRIARRHLDNGVPNRRRSRKYSGRGRSSVISGPSPVYAVTWSSEIQRSEPIRRTQPSTVLSGESYADEMSARMPGRPRTSRIAASVKAIGSSEPSR